MVAVVVLTGILAATVAAEPVSPATPKAANAQDLRPQFDRFNLSARVQGKRPTCSVFTMTAAIEFALAKHGRKDPRLSVEFLNWASNQITGEAEDGSYFSHLWEGFEAHGQCPEEDMPYQPEFDPDRKPSDEALRQAKKVHEAGLRMHWIKHWDPTRGLKDRHFDEIKRVLAEGNPVCGGFLWPKEGLERWDDGILPMYRRKQVRDGHSILLIGFRDDPTQPGGGVFLIRNSSSPHRHAEMPYEYAKAYMNDALWIDSGKRDK
ncbi:MAG: C1 family peptidase [Pirellulaceae bacterium]|nr:C1 family peptidase [Pirellulaceae bacterium]